jgi:hypothetical protein
VNVLELFMFVVSHWYFPIIPVSWKHGIDPEFCITEKNTDENSTGILTHGNSHYRRPGMETYQHFPELYTPVYCVFSTDWYGGICL